MSVFTTIARPYAKAAFEYAVEKNTIASWGMFFQRMAYVVRDNRVKSLLQNPQIEEKDKLDFIIYLASSEATNDQRNFLAILSKFRRLLALPALAKLYDAYAKQHENMMDVEVTSAFPLSEIQKSNLQKALEIRLGKRISMAILEDKALIGGVIIHAGDFVIDGSTLGKLKRLQKTLMR